MPAIANCPDLDVELSNSEFVLIEKVCKCKILTFFEQATKMMSEGDASISLSIPVVTTIMLSLKVKKGQDLGVIQLKNGISDAMDLMLLPLLVKAVWKVENCCLCGIGSPASIGKGAG